MPATRPPPAGARPVDGATVVVLGQPCVIRVVEEPGRARVGVDPPGVVALHVPVGASEAARLQLLQAWLRRTLIGLLAPLVDLWQAAMGVRCTSFTVRRMRTRWGSCTPRTGRIRFNLELVRKPLPCVEYVVVHELAHLREPGHGPPFRRLMDRHLPDWRDRRALLDPGRRGRVRAR